MKVTYTVVKDSYTEVQEYIDMALQFFMINQCSDFKWEAQPRPDTNDYLVTVTIDAKESLSPYQ